MTFDAQDFVSCAGSIVRGKHLKRIGDRLESSHGIWKRLRASPFLDGGAIRGRHSIDYQRISMLVAVMLPSLLCVPMTLMWVPAVMALAATVLPAWVYWVLAVVWIVTELPLDVFATIVLPFTLDTVSASHGPFAPGAAACDWALLKLPCAKVGVWELPVLPCVRAAA